MSFKCKIGLHSWNGCKCSDCEKIRDEQHEWNGCKCSKCGKTRDEQHDWTKDCEKCSKCDKTRENQHSWSGCNCVKCGKIRDEQHDWSIDCEKCSKCGKTIENQHSWSGCTCSKCGKTRDEKHDWSKDCQKCSKCGKYRDNAHKWNACICTKCGEIDIWAKHKWVSGKCDNCNMKEIDFMLISAVLNEPFNKTKLVELIENGANFNCAYFEDTLFSKVIENGNYDAIQLFLNYNQPLNIDKNKLIQMNFVCNIVNAIIDKNLEKIKKLIIQHQATTSSWGTGKWLQQFKNSIYTSIEYAIKNNFTESINYLFEVIYQKPKSTMLLVGTESLIIFEYLIIEYPSLIHDKEGRMGDEAISGGSILHWLAARRLYSGNNLEKMEIVVNHGGDVDVINGFGRTPLHVSAMEGNVNEVKKLISLGAKVDIRDTIGYLPIHHLFYNISMFGKEKYINTCKLLLESGTPLFKPNRPGGGYVSFEDILQYPIVESLFPFEKIAEYHKHNDMEGPFYIGLERITYNRIVMMDDIDLIVEVIYGPHRNPSDYWPIDEIDNSSSLLLAKIEKIEKNKKHIIQEPIYIRFRENGLPYDMALRLKWIFSGSTVYLNYGGDLSISMNNPADNPMIYKEEFVFFSSNGIFKGCPSDEYKMLNSNTLDFEEKCNLYEDLDAYINLRISSKKDEIDAWFKKS